MRRIYVRLLYTMLALLLLWGSSACTRNKGTAAPPEGQVFQSPMLPSAMQSPLSPSVASTPISSLPRLVLESGYGGIQGRVTNLTPGWEKIQLVAYYCPFYPGEKPGEGIYVLEPSIQANSLVTRSGDFQHGALEAGLYVVVVGPEPNTAMPIFEQGRPQVIEIKQGEITNVGKVSIGQ